ncbi:hypothetical protein [Candidatus Halobonum tyrrellensis]|uniref:hypothetical protein n=1 Tax=Candidatus Halobonum tyrrellensis TaxID=1431545 RepID=UPI00126953E5|nr:hypothetical protein [Candidatus Halobonum tyrrellensis]
MTWEDGLGVGLSPDQARSARKILIRIARDRGRWREAGSRGGYFKCFQIYLEVTALPMKQLVRSGASPSLLLSRCRRQRNWICWAHHRDPRLSKKVPLDLSKWNESRNEYESGAYSDQSNWKSFDEAFERSREDTSISGFGFVMMGTPYCYIDIDNCVDPDSLEIDDEVSSLIDEVNSYTEISSSNTGLHIIARGNPSSYGWAPDHSDIEIGVFDGSWVDVTLQHVASTPRETNNIHKVVNELCERYNIETHGGWD